MSARSLGSRISWWGFLLVWTVLLGTSHAVRRTAKEPPVGEGESEAMLAPFERGERGVDETVRLVWRDGEAHPPVESKLPILFLHGSPGRSHDFVHLAPRLATERRTLAPDLPGFGHSTAVVPDYSIRAHADYALQLLDHLGIARAHVVAYSMGGGVALYLADAAPERVASLTMLSAIGVQEFELFGDYDLNHAVHGAQLAGLWFLFEAVPHFGWLDDAFLSAAYARNFYDTDQRPLRDILSRLEVPTLILHGERDPLVPYAVALESARLAPQAELVTLAGGHMLLFRDDDILAELITPFLRRVEAGTATRRADAEPARVARASAEFDALELPPLEGLGLVLFGALAAAGTLISEDLTCVGVGALVAAGRVPFWPGALACFLGIYIGDLLLFLAGRFLGRRALDRAPMRFILTPERVERSSEWFREKGPIVIFASRFLPGARLPTYFAAGALRTSFWSFSFWFALAAGIWTPLLVWLSSYVGGELSERVEFLQGHFLVALVVTLAAILFIVRVLLPAATHRGRRLLLSRWRRLTRWEFWPPWIFYSPIALYILWLAIRHRGLSFTASNPAMPLSGFAGESKGEILASLAEFGRHVPATLLVRAQDSAETRLARVAAFRADAGLDLPLVVKPDVGERGNGVRVIRGEAELESAIAGASEDLLVQAFVPGQEFGIFYIRQPGAPRGRIFSLAEKRLPFVVGDGERNLERLILDDERAVCMARFHLRQQASALEVVPVRGERYSLGDLGTHCRGATFLDARHLETPELADAVDALARSYDGFYFGRFDVRSASEQELARGNFEVLELNGVTSEAAHVYDPGLPLFGAWRTLAEQWNIAFEIGAANAARGACVARVGELFRAIPVFQRTHREKSPGGFKPGGRSAR